MKQLQLLGTGGTRCKKLAKNARTAVNELCAEVTVEKISDMSEIFTFGVSAMPALVIDGAVKVAGRIPEVAEIKSWLIQFGTESPLKTPSVESEGQSAMCCCGETARAEEDVPCCGATAPHNDWSTEPGRAPWVVGTVDTPAGLVPSVRTTLSWHDRVGDWMARWSIRRMQHCVKPRLYAVGNATGDSPVFISANYKMSFNRLRAELTGLNAWILVLDTKGINVWCAAGKGTFGTDELIQRIKLTKLPEIITHNRVIVPQLGAPGISAHEVRKRSGFRVVFGPVRAEDIPAFLAAGLKATSHMRRVKFPLSDRLAVVPVEIVQSSKWALLIASVFLFLGGLGPAGYAWSQVLSTGLVSAFLFLLSYTLGTVLTPVLLPWLPGRPLALKGFWTGLGLCTIIGVSNWQTNFNWWLTSLELTGLALVILGTASFMAMKFTGSTTYTSLSGVRREMRFAVPLQAVAGIFGVVLWTIGRFI